MPVVDTAKGVAMQMPILKKLLKAQDSYRLAIINGMGMSTRTETGLLIPPNLAAKLSKGNPDANESYLNDIKYLFKGNNDLYHWFPGWDINTGIWNISEMKKNIGYLNDFITNNLSLYDYSLRCHNLGYKSLILQHK